MLGTPHYMSPEQALAQEVDERGDQFALAAITYELLSGELAFAGDNIPAVVFQVAHGEPPRLEDPGGWINPEVDGVLKRALSKQASDRFTTVMEFARAFERAAVGVAEEGLARARRPLANTTRRVRQRRGLGDPPDPQHPPGGRRRGGGGRGAGRVVGADAVHASAPDRAARLGARGDAGPEARGRRGARSRAAHAGAIRADARGGGAARPAARRSARQHHRTRHSPNPAEAQDRRPAEGSSLQ